MSDGALVPLDTLAKEINERLRLADQYDTKAKDHRLAAGLQLKEARAQLPERGAWGKWLAENIKRSRADVYRCLALVKSDDPDEQRDAHEAEKQANREYRVSVSSMRQTADRTPTPSPDGFVALVVAWTRASQSERARFLARIGARRAA